MTNRPIISLKGRAVFLRYAFELIAVVMSLIFCSNVFSEMPAMHEHNHSGHGEEMQMKDMHMMRASEVVVDLETVPAELKAGSEAKILFTIKDSEGRPVRDLQITHERLVHVIIASADFTVFAHIHPDGSLHATLSPERAREAIETGWAEPHPMASIVGNSGLVMLYTPRTLEELDVIFQLIVDSYNFVTGRKVNAAEVAAQNKSASE